MMVEEQAPAKLNLTLTVGAKRPDGYHDIRSVMVCASLYDTVRVAREAQEGIRLSCSRADLPLDSRNLAFRAAEAFFRETGIPTGGLHISLEKRIPTQAGLGGGSADAAAVLRCLRRLYAPDMEMERLAAIGLTVGSDVPFCVYGTAALAEGRGELLTPAAPLPPCWIVICQPNCANDTGSMYAAIDAQRAEICCDHEAVCAALERQDLAAVAGGMRNVFELVIPPESPVFSVKRSLLEMGALNAMMSGSGSAVYGLFSEETAAVLAAERLKLTYRETFLAKNV